MVRHLRLRPRLSGSRTDNVDHPEYLYFAGLALIAAPLMPFNRHAALVIGAWLPGRFAYTFGYDADALNAVFALLAFAACLTQFIMTVLHDTNVHRLVISSLMTLSFAAIVGCKVYEATDAYHGWWADYWCSMAQLALLPFGADWSAVWNMLVRVDDRIMRWLASHFARLIHALR